MSSTRACSVVRLGASDFGEDPEGVSGTSAVRREPPAIEREDRAHVERVGDDDERRIGIVHWQHTKAAHETHRVLVPRALDRHDGYSRGEQQLEGKGRTARPPDEVHGRIRATLATKRLENELK